MEKKEFIELVMTYYKTADQNYVSEAVAICSDLAGMQMFEDPLFGFGAASDALFQMFKSPSGIGDHFLLPDEWLPGAETVISIFLPFTKSVRKSNASDPDWPSAEWLHARIEGQTFIASICKHIVGEMKRKGYSCVSPANDSRFISGNQTTKFTSNWSERHVAYACGLGTFGLSKGIITKKGMAGRLCSIITGASFVPDVREYQSLYQYCSMCGACVRRCPVDAISLDKGKDHIPCSNFVHNTIEEKFAPRYGCGKCQVSVPCEQAIPVHHQSS